MDEIRSVNGVAIRLTDERWLHIVEARDELADRSSDVLEAVQRPDWVTKGYRGSLVAWKGFGKRGYLAVIYKELGPDDGFISPHSSHEAQKTRKDMAQIAEIQPKDLARILKAVPQLVRFPATHLWIDYDAEADVLYLGFAKPQRATDSELRDDGIIIHRRGKKVVGLTIQDASTR